MRFSQLYGRRLAVLFSVLLCTISSIVACGQKGPLKLPEKQEKPVFLKQNQEETQERLPEPTPDLTPNNHK